MLSKSKNISVILGRQFSLPQFIQNRSQAGKPDLHISGLFSRSSIPCIFAATILILFFMSAPALCDEEPSEDDHHSWQWLTDGELSGEFCLRYKHENVSGEEDSISQVQLNLDYEVELNDSWEWMMGLRTGSTSRPTRGWVNHELFFEETTFFIKPWTITHSGDIQDDRVKTTIGAFEYPFEQSGTVFDGDVIRPGLMQEFSFDLSGYDFDLGWSAQYLQNGDEHGDSWVIGGDAKLRLDSGDSSRTTIHLGYADFLNVDTIGQAIIEERLLVSGHAPDIGTTNVISEEGNFASDFNILIFGVEHKWGRGSDWPVAIWGEYISNLGANNDEDSRNKGFSLGVEFGDRDDAGDIFLGFTHLKLEDDAALEVYNKGKFGTNVKGWNADLRYCLTDDLILRLEGFWLETNSPRDDIETFNSRITQISMIYEF